MLEHDFLALGTHRVDQCLVTIAQINRTPSRCLLDDSVGPGAIGQIDGKFVVYGRYL
jgi:hypothetical protein